MATVIEANEQGILFSAEMIHAILGNLKSQSRRAINRVKGFGPVTEFKPSLTPGYDWTFRDRRRLWQDVRHGDLLDRCPYGRVGDRLWVRESWYQSGTHRQSHPEDDEYKLWAPRGYRSVEHIHYRADGPPIVRGRNDWGVEVGTSGRFTPDERGWYWRAMPSIHMPRWASRITLEITHVRVERLQDITAADVESEGVRPDRATDHPNGVYFTAWMSLWSKINGQASWDANPHVWALSFRRIVS